LVTERTGRTPLSSIKLMTCDAGTGAIVEWEQVILAAIGLFLAGLVKGATGLGYST